MKFNTRSASLGLALMAVAAGSAWARPTGAYTSYFVTGSASAGAPGDGRSAMYQCNTTGQVHELSGCSINGSRTPAATIYQGTVDSTGRTRAFFAETQANEFHVNYDTNNQPIFVNDSSFSRARAAADLADATVRVSVANNPDSGGYLAGSAQADWHDILSLQVAGAGADTTTRVQFRISVGGSVVNDGRTTIYGEPGSGSLSAWFGLDNRDSGFGSSVDYALYASAGWQNFRGVFTTPARGALDNRSTHAGGSWTTLGNELMVFDGYFDIVGASAELHPTLSMSLDCSMGLQCDYGHTARFSFVGLPSTVSFTSDSGVFLTAVPEPGSSLMWLAGLGALGFMARRRQG